MYKRLHRILACNGQTDGQTDGRTDILPRHSPRYAYASRGKNQTVIDCLQLSDTETRDEEKMTSFLKSCIFIFWVNRPTQNLTG